MQSCHRLPILRRIMVRFRWFQTRFAIRGINQLFSIKWHFGWFCTLKPFFVLIYWIIYWQSFCTCNSILHFCSIWLIFCIFVRVLLLNWLSLLSLTFFIKLNIDFLSWIKFCGLSFFRKIFEISYVLAGSEIKRITILPIVVELLLEINTHVNVLYW